MLKVYLVILLLVVLCGPLLSYKSVYPRNLQAIALHRCNACTNSNIIKQITASTSLAILLLLNAPVTSVQAAVGEGDLPEGVLAFNRLLKYESEWKKLAQTITERKSSLENQEVLNIKAFLKRLANEYSDMELLSRGILDKEKATQAIDIAKTFRKVVRECDDAASRDNFDQILSLYPETISMIDNYLSLLQDVPDEL